LFSPWGHLPFHLASAIGLTSAFDWHDAFVLPFALTFPVRSAFTFAFALHYKSAFILGTSVARLVLLLVAVLMLLHVPQLLSLLWGSQKCWPCPDLQHG